MRGLEGPVDLYRDAQGVPHVLASTTHDAFLVQGYVHAADRLWQMEYDRLKAAGRTAAHIGAGGLTRDVFMRRLDLVGSARRDYEAFDGQTRAMLDAYAAGVNAYLETGRLPLELELLGHTPAAWRPWDCGAALKVRHVLMGNFDAKLWRERLVRALGPRGAGDLASRAGRDDLLIVPPGTWEAAEGVPSVFTQAATDGSNSWAVHGTRTASGMPLLAGDPHRLLEVPNVYVQIHIACGEFDAVGLSIPGTPGLYHFGHNRRTAWSITHAMADTQDLYVERFRDDGCYLSDGDWRPATRRTETVEVAGDPPVSIEVVETGHGPVLFGDPASGEAVTMRWTGTDGVDSTLECVLPILRAQTVGELDEAMRRWVDPCNSLVTADVDGHIAYLHRGRVPVRSPANAWTPVPGWTGEHEWTGNVAFEDLPRLLDPPTGWIATANNRVCGRSYAHHLGVDYAEPHRAARLVDRLYALDQATVDDMASVHADRFAPAAGRILEAVLSLDGLQGAESAARDILAGWDGGMEPEATAPTLYACVREHMAELLLSRDPLSACVDNPFPEEPDAYSALTRLRAAIPRLLASGETSVLGGLSWEQVTRQALSSAVEALSSELGADPATWKWSRVHVTRIVHPLSNRFPGRFDTPSLPCPGDRETVQVSGGAQRGFAVTSASVARYVFDTSDWNSSGWVVPLGSSGDPGDPHFADQAQTWARAELFPMTYSWDAVARGAEDHRRLEPAG